MGDRQPTLVIDARLREIGARQLGLVTGTQAMAAGIDKHAKAPPEHRRWMTSRVASPAATVLHLPGTLDAAAVERCLDHALAHRLTTVAALSELLGRTQPGAVVGRRLLLDSETPNAVVS